MFEKFTERARRGMSHARKEAQRLGDGQIGTDHLLLGIMECGGVGARVLHIMNVDARRVREGLEKRVSRSGRPAVVLGHMPFSPRAKVAIEMAGSACQRMTHDVIGSEHLLLGLLEEGEGLACQVLHELGVNLEKARETVLEVLGAGPGIDNARPVYVRGFMPKNLMGWAERERMLVDRPGVQDTVVQQLLRGRNVALVGPSGAGKTFLVMALSRGSAAGIKYYPLDYRVLDPFSDMSPVSLPENGGVWFVGQGDTFNASERDKVRQLLELPDRFILEFRERGFEEFTVRFPAAAKRIVPVKVSFPVESEMWPLLHAGRTRLLEATGFTVSDADLREIHSQVAREIPDPRLPWDTFKVMWAAAPVEKEMRIPEEARKVMREMEEAERLKDEMVGLQRFEEAAKARDRWWTLRDTLRELERLSASRGEDPADARISLAALRRAIVSVRGK